MGQEESEEVHKPRRIPTPILPSRDEVDEHNVTHVPYRNWCPHCIRGRGRDLDHRRSVEEGRRVLEFSFDYCFMGDSGEERITILVGRERSTGMSMATVVPAKGGSGQFAVLKVLKFIRLCGAEESDIILKTDQEPAIEVLVKDIVKARGAVGTVVEKSPVGSSGSNGVVERAVQSVEGVIRTLKSACEARWDIALKPGARTIVFLTEYAAYLLNKLEVGKDGKTAWERSRGKKGVVMAVEFGERVLWRVKPAGRMAKLNPRWEYGVFVGVRPESGEVLVATKEGLQTVRAVRRLPMSERWSANNSDYIRHLPGDRPADEDMPDEAEEKEETGQRDGGAEAQQDGGGEGPRVVVVNTRATLPKEFYIKRRDVEVHGMTRSCAGCRTMFGGGTRQSHNAECRERFRQLMQGEDRVRRMEVKRKHFLDRAAEDEQRRLDKKQRKEEKKAAKGRKRTAVDEDLDAERLARAEPAEGEEDGDRQAAREGGEGGDGRAGSSGDGDGRPGSSGDGGGPSGGRGGGDGDMEVNGEGGGMEIGAVMRGNAYWDDVRGGWLDKAKVYEARMEELGFMQREHLWDVVPRSRAAGHRVVSVRWVDTNKGTDERPDIRCRLVARDFNSGTDRDREDLFAATPPWELKRLLLSHAADREGGGSRKVMLVDVKKAHLYPLCQEEVYIELPEEVGAGPACVGRLRRMLYGLRAAAATWENHYASKLEEIGFKRGVATPVAFHHRERGLSVVVHGDDFTFTGDDAALEWVLRHMKSWYQLKLRAKLGAGVKDDKEAVLLGRILRWHEWGITCEADPKYREKIMAELGLSEDSKSLGAPGTREEDAKVEEFAAWMGDDTKYRAIVAIVNYLAVDQPDLQFASKEACRDMSAPSPQSWAKLKRIGRYLVGRSQVVWRFPWKKGPGGWKVTVDSDWAGDRVTRRSTSGGVIRLGDHCLKTWSSTQSSPALSSCEAEYYAMVDGATRMLGLEEAARELGIVGTGVDLETDASAAKSYASRRGAGRIRHIEVKYLWLQKAVADGRFRLVKLLGTENPADVLTKYKTLAEARGLLRPVGVELVGRSGPEQTEENGYTSCSEWIRLSAGQQWADVEEEEWR